MEDYMNRGIASTVDSLKVPTRLNNLASGPAATTAAASPEQIPLRDATFCVSCGANTEQRSPDGITNGLVDKMPGLTLGPSTKTYFLCSDAASVDDAFEGVLPAANSEINLTMQNNWLEEYGEESDAEHFSWPLTLLAEESASDSPPSHMPVSKDLPTATSEADKSRDYMESDDGNTSVFSQCFSAWYPQPNEFPPSLGRVSWVLYGDGIREQKNSYEEIMKRNREALAYPWSATWSGGSDLGVAQATSAGASPSASAPLASGVISVAPTGASQKARVDALSVAALCQDTQAMSVTSLEGESYQANERNVKHKHRYERRDRMKLYAKDWLSPLAGQGSESCPVSGPVQPPSQKASSTSSSEVREGRKGWSEQKSKEDTQGGTSPSVSASEQNSVRGSSQMHYTPSGFKKHKHKFNLKACRNRSGSPSQPDWRDPPRYPGDEHHRGFKMLDWGRPVHVQTKLPLPERKELFSRERKEAVTLTKRYTQGSPPGTGAARTREIVSEDGCGRSLGRFVKGWRGKR